MIGKLNVLIYIDLIDIPNSIVDIDESLCTVHYCILVFYCIIYMFPLPIPFHMPYYAIND